MARLIDFPITLFDEALSKLAPRTRDEWYRRRVAKGHDVCIPQKAANCAERQSWIEAQCDQYQYTWHRPLEVASAVDVPLSGAFTAPPILRFAGVKLELHRHRLKAELSRVREAARNPAKQGRRGTPDVCASYFEDRRTPFVTKYLEGPQGHDRLHAWQRIGGSNPLMIQRARLIPDAFPVTQEHFARALGRKDTLEAARKEGRLYLGDWTSLDGRAAGLNGTHRKYLYGPWALYVQSVDGVFLPVAIQCRSRPGPDAPIFTPADGKQWEMAKLVVQCADTQIQALHFHLGRCHFLMEAFTLSTMRRLPDQHPVKVLLRPHMQYTLSINHMVRDELMVPGARMDSMMAPTYEHSLEIVRASVKAFSLKTSLPPADIAARDVADLSPYPWREDVLDVWHALHDFVGAYLRLYYDDDDEVRADPEVIAWATEMRSEWGGRIDVPVPRGRAELAELVSYVIFVAGPLHSLINYSQFDNMAFAPNMPMALYGEAPDGTTEDAEAALEKMYLPDGLAQYGFFFEQSQLKENVLGHYPAGTFADPHARDLARAFLASLSEVEARIDERNQRRLVPYTWLRPSEIRGSIHS